MNCPVRIAESKIPSDFLTSLQLGIRRTNSETFSAFIFASLGSESLVNMKHCCAWSSLLFSPVFTVNWNIGNEALPLWNVFAELLAQRDFSPLVRVFCTSTLERKRNSLASMQSQSDEAPDRAPLQIRLGQGRDQEQLQIYLHYDKSLLFLSIVANNSW